MPKRQRAFCDQALRNLRVFANCNDEQPWPRLRNEQSGVNDHCADSVSSLLQGSADRREIVALVGSQRPTDVFKHNQSWLALFLHETLHQIPALPKRSRAVAFQSGAASGTR